MTDQNEKRKLFKETEPCSEVQEASEAETKEVGLHNLDNKKIHYLTQANHNIDYSATDLLSLSNQDQKTTFEMVDEEAGYILTAKGYKPLVPEDISATYQAILNDISAVKDPELLPEKVAEATIEYCRAKGMITEEPVSLEELQVYSSHYLDDPNNGSDKLQTISSVQAAEFKIRVGSNNETLIETGIGYLQKIEDPPPPNFMTDLSPEIRTAVIAAFQQSGQIGEQAINETADEILRKTIQGYIDTVKLPIDVVVAAGKCLWQILEFERDLVLDPARAELAAASAGEQLGKVLVAGTKIWTAGSEYATAIRESGDYKQLFQDLGSVMNAWFESLTPGDQMYALASISAGFGIDAAAGELRKLVKSGAFVQFLEEAALKVPKNQEAQAKAIDSIRKLIEVISSKTAGLRPAFAGESVESRYPTGPGFKDRWDDFTHKMESHKSDGEFVHKNPIDSSATTSEKVQALRQLSKENEKLVRDFTEHVDSKYGTQSSISFKEPTDIIDKASRASIKADKPWFDVEHIGDALRFKTPIDNLQLLPEIIEDLLNSQFEIIKLDLNKLLVSKARGWRMAAIDVKAPNGQMIEFQILPRKMNEAGAIEHSLYKRWRVTDAAKLTPEQKILRQKADLDAAKLFETSWNSYLRRTGQSPEDISKIIDSVNKLILERKKN